MMLPQPRSLRRTVQRRPSHRSNYLARLLPSAASSLLFISRSMLRLKFRSYLSKYLILHMLNYYPIQREHQISAAPGPFDGPKSGHSGAIFGDPLGGYQQVTGRTLDQPADLPGV